jgi:3-oxoacyl-[acyl-carrier-protein] synthase-1
MSQPVYVVGVGMMTPVGLSAAESAASVRSALTRFSESDHLDHSGNPCIIAEVPEVGLPVLQPAIAGAGVDDRDARLLRLAAATLQECIETAAGRLPARPLVMALSEDSTELPIDAVAFLELLERQTNGAFDRRESDASHRGRAGGLAAIGRAVELVATGRADAVVAAGADTFRDPDILSRLDTVGRVKSAANLDGMIPGEAAGALLLAGPGGLAALGAEPLARLSPVVLGFEPGHLGSAEPYRGEGLAAVLTQLAAEEFVAGPFAEVYSSMNGESHWAKEWGVAFIRNARSFSDDLAMHHPADCWGEVGGATASLLVGLASIGIAQGYRRSPTLVYCSSDFGPRAAVAVSAP